MKKGFTLVELLAVIVILAILVFYAIPNIFRSMRESKMEVFRTEAGNIIEAAASYYAKEVMNGGNPSLCISLDQIKTNMDKNFDGYSGSVLLSESLDKHQIWLSNKNYMISTVLGENVKGQLIVLEKTTSYNASSNCN